MSVQDILDNMCNLPSLKCLCVICELLALGEVINILIGSLATLEKVIRAIRLAFGTYLSRA